MTPHVKLISLFIAIFFACACNSLPKPATQPAPAAISKAPPWPRPAVQIEPGKVRPALPDRIVSFHKGRADKSLIKLAHDLNFNGVQIQIEGSTIQGIKDFAVYDSKEHLVDYCHSLNMKVTLWVHELSDIPDPWLPEWLGTVTPDNKTLWMLLDARYDWMLHDAVPNIDGLALTVVETQIRATNTDVMVKLVSLLRKKCDQYGKRLIVRTFVWYPDEFNSVMKAIDQLPEDQVIMSKCVPQDWNLRGTYASEIGNVGGRSQIVEFDIAGEYFQRNRVANCMLQNLKRHFDYDLAHNIKGICVRVDRDDASVLHQPNEVNLWALGMLACGATDDLDEIWHAWATNRFGAPAADGVIRALKPTETVVSEMLNIGPFSFGDTRYFPPLGDENLFGQLHQNYWWDPVYEPIHQAAENGDPDFTALVQRDKYRAAQLAQLCLLNLELVRDQLAPQDYAILKTRLITNKIQLAYRSAMALAALHYRRLTAENADADAQNEADLALQSDLAHLRAVTRPIYSQPTTINWLGQSWQVGPPEDVPRDWIYHWAYQMDQLRRGENPRATRP